MQWRRRPVVRHPRRWLEDCAGSNEDVPAYIARDVMSPHMPRVAEAILADPEWRSMTDRLPKVSSRPGEPPRKMSRLFLERERRKYVEEISRVQAEYDTYVYRPRERDLVPRWRAPFG